MARSTCWLTILGALACAPAADPPHEERTTSSSLVWPQKQKLVASDGEALEQAGEGVGIAGDVAFVGSKQDDDFGTGSGSVYVFTRNALGSWTQTQQLNASDASAGDWFGEDLSISGDRAVVTARQSEPPPPFFGNSGQAYVFERNAAGSWIEVQIIHPDAPTGGQFAWDVGISGDGIISSNHSLQNAYIFERDSLGVWNQVQILTKSDGNSDDHFGWSVGISGSRAIVGAPQHDALANNSGGAYVFERNAVGTWVQVQKLVPSDGGNGDFFGQAAAISGNYAAVGAPFHAIGNCANCGAVYVFERDASGTWSQVQKLTVVTPNAGDFGNENTIAIDGDRIAAGHFSESNPPGQGAAYVFERSASGVWIQAPKLTPLDPVLGHGFAQHSVAISGSRVIAGAIFDDQVANQAGAAYVFEGAPGTGDACTSSSECASGFCVDGVCCDSACGGGLASDCQACSVASGAPANGTCAYLPATIVCRASAGACDVAELCGGSTAACPADAFTGTGTTCRPAQDDCDVEEKCDGTSAACPTDAFATQGQTCRAASDACDVEEKCDGTSAACPADALATPDQVCRPAAASCDLDEKCSGVDAQCPADQFAGAGTTCRAATESCDVEEQCDGASADCPVDAVVGQGQTCRPAASACDANEQCDGTNAACPTDAFLPDGSSCTGGVCQSGACEPAATGGAGGQAGSAGAAGAAGAVGGGPGGDDSDEEGCSCANVGAPTGAVAPGWLAVWPLGLLLLCAARRRRGILPRVQ